MNEKFGFIVLIVSILSTLPELSYAQFLDVVDFTPGGVNDGQFAGVMDESMVEGAVIESDSDQAFLNIGTIQEFGATNIDGTSPQFSFDSSYCPTQLLGDRIGYCICSTEETLVQLTFSPPVLNVSFHVANLDGAVLDFSPSGLFESEVEIANSNGNLDELPGGQISGGSTVGFDATQDPLGAASGYGSIELTGVFSEILFKLVRENSGDAGSFTISGETIVHGDINCDGVVNLLDVSPFVDLVSSGGFSAKADFDNNGVVNLLDVPPFVDALVGG